MYDKLLTITEVAKLLGVSPSTLRRSEANGQVKGYGLNVVYTPGGQRRYIFDEIHDIYSKGGFSSKVGFGQHCALLIRDLTKAFITDGSRLSIKTPISIAGVDELVAAARLAEVPIVFTKTVYIEGDAFSELWARKFPAVKTLLPEAVHNAPIVEIAKVDFDRVQATSYVSDFWDTGLVDYLRDKKIDTIILMGATASGSIRATTVEGIQHGFQVIIPRETIGDRSQSLLDMTVLDLNARYADIVSVADTVQHFRSLEAK